MALGLPIVSTNVGGMPFLIENNKHGILVEPNIPDLFVEAIRDIISLPEKTNQMVLHARNHVEQFDWEIIKSQWIKVLQ
jgi:glycosyltransferase involved in cell wall biosynthesis